MCRPSRVTVLLIVENRWQVLKPDETLVENVKNLFDPRVSTLPFSVITRFLAARFESAVGTPSRYRRSLDTSNASFDYFIQFSLVQPNATTTGTVIDLDTGSLRHL